MGDFLQLCGYDVCCALHRVSQVMCLLPFQALAEALQQNSTLTYLDLIFNNIGPEGAKAWCLGKREWGNCKRHSRVKVTLGKEEMHCNAALIPRCIYPIGICDDKCFMTILFPHKVFFLWVQNQVTMSFWNSRSSNQVWNGIPILRMLWSWNGLRCSWLSQIVQEDYSGLYFLDFKSIIKVLLMEEILHHLRSCIKPCNIKWWDTLPIKWWNGCCRGWNDEMGG